MARHPWGAATRAHSLVLDHERRQRRVHSEPLGQEPSSWTFVTNHTQVLLRIAQDPGVRLRDVAETVGITERAAQRILADLVAAGYVERTRVGRRNEYTINRDKTMRHVAQLGQEVGGLLDLLSPAGVEADPR